MSYTIIEDNLIRNADLDQVIRDARRDHELGAKLDAMLPQYYSSIGQTKPAAYTLSERT